MVFRLFIIACALLVLHFGWQLGEPHMKNYLLEGKMKELVKNRGMRGEKDLKRDIMAYAREKDIPLNERHLVVNLDNSGVSIAAQYRTHVDVLFHTQEYVFTPASSEQARQVFAGRTF